MCDILVGIFYRQSDQEEKVDKASFWRTGESVMITSTDPYCGLDWKDTITVSVCGEHRGQLLMQTIRKLTREGTLVDLLVLNKEGSGQTCEV